MVITATSNRENSPYVISVDGILGREALVVKENFSPLMAAKIYEPIFHV